MTHRARKPDKSLKIGSDIVDLTPSLYVNNIHMLLVAALSGAGIINVHDYIPLALENAK